ncbi:RNA polymerase sigma-70 factor [Pedobacter sp. ASV1-7]|jgi:RNA polymerase sigma-70 factor (family 1)|uniref:RNA polymerase sigma factor n=1 Tax=Pedobacter sp. ASV1-7 TaxID=3145237 RepID=UPI0032E872AE
MHKYCGLSDVELSDLLKSGDHFAYSEIYTRYKGPLYIHAYNKLRNREEAKDLVQELFTVLWNKRDTLLLTDNLASYLYGAVRNRVFRIIGRKGIESSYITSIQDSVNKSNCVTDHRVRENLLQKMIDREIDSLPPKMKEVFLMSRKENLSHKEIADKLGITEPTVKKQVNNALKTLRVKLGLFAYLIFLLK